ncbi:GNAT family N-acetyltransferase [Pseudomonas sp. 210_17 TE3656]
MPSIVDPHVSFLTFQKAVREGQIKLSPCAGHPDLHVMSDELEDGTPRLTYALISGSHAKAYAVYFLDKSMNGKPCFEVGYATDDQLRNQGLATEVVKASISDLYGGMSRHLPTPVFYVEAIVGRDNLASQKVAARVLNAEPDEITDKVSGLPAFHYVKLIRGSQAA